MKIIGIRKSEFTGSDGDTVKGVNYYLTEPMTASSAEGLLAERVYLTEKRLSELGFVPKLGDEVSVEYNRFGKCSGLRLNSSSK
ncbi:MAG: hypothetical protein HFF09_00605 [Oscillospiraceae bacterium]|nr:hypothetical protein [Oscillospiraceae bacterium]